MIGVYELVVLLLSVVISLGAVGVCLYQRCFLRYSLLILYLLANVAFTSGCYYVIAHFGYDSKNYYFFYYTGDALVNITGFILIGSFFDRLLRESIFHKYVRPTLMIAFLLIVGISSRFLAGNLDRFTSRFVYEFQQNMYFVGVLLTFLLWISMSYLRAETRRFVLLVSGLGIYWSAHAANYALQFLFPVTGYPNLSFLLTKIPPLAYNLMALLWLYTFWRVPEDEVAVLKAPDEAMVAVPTGRK